MIRLFGHGFARLFGYNPGENFWTGNKLVDNFFVVHSIALFGGLLLLGIFSVIDVQNRILVYSVLYPTVVLGIGGICLEPALRGLLVKNRN